MDWPGEKLVTRLWDTVADKGIGGLLKPWQIRREGRAHIDVRRQELLVLAQATKDVEEIKSGRAKLLPSGEVVNAAAHAIGPSAIPNAHSSGIRRIAASVTDSVIADA